MCKICNDQNSTLEDDVCELALHNSTDNNVCANCGKEGSDINNICNKCKIVKYCNAACKKRQRHKHKEECEEHVRLATLRNITKNSDLLLRNMIKNYSKNHHQKKIVQFVSYVYRHIIWEVYYILFICCGKVICSGCFVMHLFI
jgi:hypothetical protein